VDEAKSHQSVDWRNYFKSIRTECPWSYRADQQGLIDITPWRGVVEPLGTYQARVYLIEASDQEVEALASALDHGEDEWLFSYPGYGEYATPVSVLIQQNRKELNQIRNKQNANT
jgi:hypothetical protein